MKVIVTKSYEESCQTTANMIIDQVKRDPSSKLGLATGGTAEQIYPYLVTSYQKEEVDYSAVTTVNLDEYVGMDPSSPQSYRKYMDRLFFDHVNIDKANTYVPSGMNDRQEEIALFNEKLYGDKFIDLQLLGVGVSGHIGFNEPHTTLTAGVHIEQLNESTIASNARFFESQDQVPREAITMGIGDIMKAKKIVLIATGESKATAIKSLLMNDDVSCEIPVTLLKLHRDTVIVIDEALAAAIEWEKAADI